MAFESSHLTAAEQVTHALRNQIVKGLLAAGTPIRQEELANTHQVSRMPVREALRQLEAEGLVVIYPGRGAFVNRPKPEEIREIYDIRILLETDALRRAFPNFSRGVLGTAEDVQDALTAAPDGPTFGQLDIEFHTTLYTPSNRPRLLNLIQTLRNQVTQAFYAVTPLDTFRTTALAEHREILDACHRGDIDKALTTLTHHLSSSAQYIAQRWE